MPTNPFVQPTRPQSPVPSKPLPALTFSLVAADILALIEPYCRSLAAQRDVPFFEFVLDLIDDVPDYVRPRANAFAQKMLINEAFRQLDGRAKLENDILTQLLELPLQISRSLSEDASKNATEIWNLLFPKLKAEIQAQATPQIQLLRSLTGDQETPWINLPHGRERLAFVLEICRDRVVLRFPLERVEQFNWLALWADDLVWAWLEMETAIAHKHDLFAPEQQHLLTRVLRSVYHPKCSLPGLPLSEALRHEAFLPLYLEVQATQAALDGLLRTRLDAQPILPQIGDKFAPERHTAPRTFWRAAQSEKEQPDTVHEVREIGLERHGQVLIKATVGIVETPAPAHISQEPLLVPASPDAARLTSHNLATSGSQGGDHADPRFPPASAALESMPPSTEQGEPPLWPATE